MFEFSYILLLHLATLNVKKLMQAMKVAIAKVCATSSIAKLPKFAAQKHTKTELPIL